MWRTDTGAEAWLRRNVWDCTMKCIQSCSYIPYTRECIMINACAHVCRCTSKFYVSHLFTVEHIKMRDFSWCQDQVLTLDSPMGPGQSGPSDQALKHEWMCAKLCKCIVSRSYPMLAHLNKMRRTTQTTLSYSFHLRICPAWFRILRAQIVQAFCSSVDVLLMFALSMDPGQKIVVHTAVGAKTYALPNYSGVLWPPENLLVG